MSLIHCGTVADDDGDEIAVEAERAERADGAEPADGVVYLTVNPADRVINGGTVALRREQVERFAKAWVEASRIAEGGAAGE